MTVAFENRNTLVISERHLDGGPWPCGRDEHAAQGVFMTSTGIFSSGLGMQLTPEAKPRPMRNSSSSDPTPGVKFARMVFLSAGAWGLVTLTPLYFAFDLLSRLNPPPISHPQFYFGFVGVALAWPFAFFGIGMDPVRFRPMIIPALLEKLGFVLAVAVLYMRGRLSPAKSIPAGADLVWVALFATAFFRLKHRESESVIGTASR